MMTEAGVPAVMGLLLEVNAGVRLSAAGSLLEVVPLMALALLGVLHWDQAHALVRRAREKPRFALRLKRPPLSSRYVGGILAAIGAFGALPYAEELWRCFRVDRMLAARPVPSLPATPTLRLSAE